MSKAMIMMYTGNITVEFNMHLFLFAACNTSCLGEKRDCSVQKGTVFIYNTVWRNEGHY